MYSSIPSRLGALTLLFVFAFPYLATGQCDPVEWQTLQTLYLSTDGPNWDNNAGWSQVDPGLHPNGPAADCDLSSLYGITLDGDGSVTGIDLGGNNLSGDLPAALGDLQALTSLDLSGNNLTGPLPASFAGLANLISLDLTNNSLSGCYDPSLAAGDGSDPGIGGGGGGTVYTRPSSTLVVSDFDPATDMIELGAESIHTQIMFEGPTGLTFQNMFQQQSTIIFEGIFLKDLQWFNFMPIADAHFQQDISATLAYENCTGLMRPNTVYVRSHQQGLEEVVPFNLATDKVSFFYLCVRGDGGVNFSVEQTAEGARFFSPYTGQSLTLAGIDFADLTPAHFEFRANQLEDNIAGRMGLDTQVPNWQVDAAGVFNGKSVPMAGGEDRAPYHVFAHDPYTGDPICTLSNSQLCNFGNGDISDGNNFNVAWEDFCADGNGDCQPPAIVLIEPTSNASFQVNTSVNISASVIDGDGSVADVSITADGTPLTTASTGGDIYTATWTPTAAGTYLLTVSATDNEGLVTTTSTSVTITTRPPGSENTDPVAEFLADPSSGLAPLTVNFDGSTSSDADGDALTYLWAFEPGYAAGGATATYTFAAAGVYPVTLTVDDGNGGTSTAQTTITVFDPTPQPPTAFITASSTNGAAPLAVTFDGTGSTDPNGDELTYSWDFGDGNTATGPTATNVFTQEGLYSVTLTVDDGNGGSSQAMVAVNAIAVSCDVVLNYRNTDINPNDNQVRPYFTVGNNGSEPIALEDITVRYWFTREGTESQDAWIDWARVGNANVTTNFVELSTPVAGADHYLEFGFTAAAGSIAAGDDSGPVQARFNKSNWSNYDETDDHSYSPDFTDYAPWENVTVYCNGLLAWGNEPGGVIDDDDDDDDDNDNNGPLAVASATPSTGTAPLYVSFDASASTDADGDALSFAWDFGDGNTATGSSPAHTYVDPGTYSATVTVSDGNGGSDTETIVVTVEPAGGGDSNIEVVFTVNSSWNSGFCASVEIINNGSEAINGWTFEFDHPGNINNLWNANWSNLGGITYRTSDVGWNASIPPGSSRSFGYCSSHSGTLESPTNGSVNGAAVPIAFINGNASNFAAAEVPAALRAGALQIRPTVVDQQAELYYQLSESGPARLELIDQSGRLIRTLVAATLTEGDYYFRLGTEALASGTYYVRLVAANGQLIERMIVAR